jgi:hypothetical protein
MINFKSQQNIVDLILIFVIFLGSFFFQSSLISFKLIYALQIIIILYFLIKYSKINIDRKIVILNLGYK